MISVASALRAPILLLLAVAGSSVYAQSVERPHLTEGDKWVYRAHIEESKNGVLGTTVRDFENSIARAGAQTIVLSVKPVDSNLPPKEVGRNADWSVTRNLGGKNTVTSHPLDFPMQPGKTWKLETLEEKPAPLVKTQKTALRYSVVGWEEVKVPAGTFKALKIEAEGEWTKEFEPRGASINSAAVAAPSGSTMVAQSKAAYTPPPTGGRLYRAYWYVPEIKYVVKMIEEDQNASNELHKRVTEELVTSSIQ